MKLNLIVASMAVTLPTLAIASGLNNGVDYPVPADKFDMKNWKITIPSDINEDGKVDEIEGVAMLSYSHKDFFFLNEEGNLVFEVQNKAITTKNSTNARSELREMPRGADFSINTDDLKNHWSLSTHPNAAKYHHVGGTLEATLKVNHVARHAKFPQKGPAYSVVVGQIHAKKSDVLIREGKGFGYGNEPIKIFYKKFPEHQMGSVFWTYERNLANGDPDRIDIAYPVWGHTWDNHNEPGQAGISLGEEFSYTINVEGPIMNVTFKTARHDPVSYAVNLSQGVDDKDFPYGYAEDMFYFKAGAYGQCSTSESHPFWGTGCAGTGDFNTDKKNGDYSSVTFSELKLNGQ